VRLYVGGVGILTVPGRGVRVLGIDGVAVGAAWLVDIVCCAGLTLSCELDLSSGGGGGGCDMVPPVYDVTDELE
jgi:hypothetical protein